MKDGTQGTPISEHSLSVDISYLTKFQNHQNIKDDRSHTKMATHDIENAR